MNAIDLTEYKEDGENREEKKQRKISDTQKVVIFFKIKSGFEKDDKRWDAAFFQMHMRAAKKLLDFLGNIEDCADCIDDVYDRLSAWKDDTTIFLETIFKHSPKWYKDKRERDSKSGK